MKNSDRIYVYLFVIIISVMCIYYGNRYLNQNSNSGLIYDMETELNEMQFATVTSIDKVIKDSESEQQIFFTGKTFGTKDKKIINAKQIINENSKNVLPVTVGDKVVLLSYGGDLLFQYHYRFDKVIILGLVFVAFVILLGGIKGVNTIIALALTCLSIFFLFIPSIRAGINIYLSTILICFYIVIMSLIIIYGFNKKSKIAAISCISGVILSGILTFTMDKWMKLTGYINEDTYMFSSIFGFEVDVKAIVFSMITIGALGAIMDVSMSIASSLTEIKENNRTVKTGTLMKSGFRIGRDIMGTMTNTLILAYIGSSLIVVLVYSASNYSILSLLNKEEIIFEFLQSLIGSLCLLFTIPFTTIIASVVLSKKDALEENIRLTDIKKSQNQ